MARRRRAEHRELEPDTRYGSDLVGRMINTVMKEGKKAVAQRLIYGALDELGRMSKQEPIEVLEKAIHNAMPQLEVKSRRVGGATYQVPIEVPRSRQVALALRWIIQFSKNKRGVSMRRALAQELMDAFNNQGGSIKKRDDTHKMAQANKAFAHYRW